MKWLDKKGNTVSQSSQHPGMFIVDYPDGGFINIHSSVDLMKSSHPVKHMYDAREVKIKAQSFNTALKF